MRNVTNTVPSYQEPHSVGFGVRLVEWLDHGPDGGGSGAGDVLQPIFLTRLEDVGWRRSSGCSSHVCTSPDHAWSRKEAEKDEPKYLETATSFCNVVRTHVLDYEKKTVESSHGDDRTGAFPSRVRGPTCFVQRLSATVCATAPVLGAEPAPCRSTSAQQDRTQRRNCDFRSSSVHSPVKKPKTWPSVLESSRC